MESNEVDKLDMVAYRRASGERKVLIERKTELCLSTGPHIS